MNFYLNAFCTFFKIGLFTIGGGYAMVPLIEEEVVNKKRWITQEEFIDLLAVSQSVPGVFAVNFSIFIGYKLRKFPGALALALGAILPSFLIILSIALFFHQYNNGIGADHDVVGHNTVTVNIIRMIGIDEITVILLSFGSLQADLRGLVAVVDHKDRTRSIGANANRCPNLLVIILTTVAQTCL